MLLNVPILMKYSLKEKGVFNNTSTFYHSLVPKAVLLRLKSLKLLFKYFQKCLYSRSYLSFMKISFQFLLLLPQELKPGPRNILRTDALPFISFSSAFLLIFFSPEIFFHPSVINTFPLYTKEYKMYQEMKMMSTLKAVTGGCLTSSETLFLKSS